MLLSKLAKALLLLVVIASPFAASAETHCVPDALGVSRTLTVGTQGGLQVGFKTYPRSLQLEDHEVVLTFDDGPASRTTGEVMDALAKQCVKVTFFLIGRNAEALPRLVRRELAEGHTLGHHTFSHPAATLRGLSDSAARAEIDRGFAADDKAAYGEASTAPKVPFFRFPGFADTPALDNWLASRNIAIFGADLWASDWLPMTPEAELALILDRLEKQKHGIILLHDIKRSTAAMLPDLLSELKRRGFKIVHLVPGPGTAPTDPAPQGWSSETEKILAQLSTHRTGARHAPGQEGAVP
ncbi:MAG TPA: polysaccharide deacetylase family protein [Beijerinckia sp.]|jgi:peptidoglycan/xylan/chitin deacetylase (PgdA/CDA1 family)|nr:polysaccharide deacetylase family protein [Beijerinckia sp.]